jgi:alkylhydroperoxidase family enzyme
VRLLRRCAFDARRYGGADSRRPARCTQDARRATASDAKSQAALSFSKKLVDNQGAVEDADVEALRSAGYSDGEVAEIVANVALNIFTNYFNHVAGTEIDFPRVPELV